jgi:hypothetical protein
VRVVDEAWDLEESFWKAGTAGGVQDYYAKVLAADAFVVVPGRVLLRDDLLRQWDDRPPWTEYALTERRTVLVNGETVVLSYCVSACDAEGRAYRARVSSVYTWVARWVLAFRQHTPDPDVVGMTLR